MTQAYQEPGINIDQVLESVAADAGTGALITAVIGDVYQVEVEREVGDYDGTAFTMAYPDRMTGAVVDVESEYAPKVWIQKNGVNYLVSDNAATNQEIDLDAGEHHTVQTAAQGGAGRWEAGGVFESASARFIDKGVQAGDKIRVSPPSTSDEHEIVTVVNNNRVLVKTRPSAGAVSAYAVVRDLSGGKVVVSYRAARRDPDIKNKYLLAAGTSDLIDHFGKDAVDTPQNPVGYGMSLALRAGGVTVGGAPIDPEATPATEYGLAIEELNKQRVYNVVPLTASTALQDQVIQHIKDSSERQNRERRAYIWRDTDSEVSVAENAALSVAGVAATNTFTITGTSGTAATDKATGTTAIADVQPGDRFIFGGVEYVVNSKAENRLVVGGIGTDITDAVATWSVVRKFTKDQEASSGAGTARALRSERVTLVGAGDAFFTINGTETRLPGYYVAAIKAGQRSGAAVGQPLIRAALPFVTRMEKDKDYFNQDQLNALAGGGTQLFVRDGAGATPYCRDELTTNQTAGPKLGQESEVVARDFAAYLFRDTLQPIIGTFNITPRTLNILRTTANAVIANLLREQYQPFTSITLETLVASTANPGRVEMTVRMTQSDPLTGIDVTLII